MGWGGGLGASGRVFVRGRGSVLALGGGVLFGEGGGHFGSSHLVHTSVVRRGRCLHFIRRWRQERSRVNPEEVGEEAGGEGVRPVVDPCKSKVRAPRDAEEDGTSLVFAIAVHYFYSGRFHVLSSGVDDLSSGALRNVAPRVEGPIPATQVSRGVEGDLQGTVIVRDQGFAEVARQEVEEVRIHTPKDTDTSETGSVEGELASEVSADEIPDVAREEPEMRIPHMRGIAVVNLENVFTFRPCFMKSVPRFMRGPFRNCVRVALDEIVQGHSAHDVLRYMVTSPARVGVAYTAMQEESFRHAGFQIRGSKPEVCDTLQRIAIADDPQARVWRGSGLL